MECSSTLVWPIVDGLLATVLVFGARSNLEGAADPSRSNGNPTGMVINFVAAGVATASLAHGLSTAGECEAAREAVAENDLDGEPERTGAQDILAQHVMGVACGEPFQDPLAVTGPFMARLLVFNDDWKETQQAEIEATGMAPSSEAESAIVASLLIMV